MSEHQAAIDAIERADSHGEIRNIVRGYSAAALDPDAHSLLYSDQILEAPSGSDAEEQAVLPVGMAPPMETGAGGHVRRPALLKLAANSR